MPAPSWRTASAVAPIKISKSPTQTKDPISVTQFPTTTTTTTTTTTPFNFDLDKNINICDPVLYAPSILLPPVLLGYSLNPMAAPYPSESLLDPTADSFHPTPSASINIPPPLPVTTPSAGPNIPVVVAPSPESQHDELDSSFPIQHDELEHSGIPHDELDDLI